MADHPDHHHEKSLLVGEQEEGREYGQSYEQSRPKSWTEVRDHYTDVQDDVKRGFIRKVYSLLFVQLLITIGISCLFMFEKNCRVWILKNPWTMWIWMIGSFIVLIALFFKKNSYPINMILLFSFTTLESLFIGTICAAYYQSGAGEAVFVAFGITGGIVLGLTVFTFVSKIDFSFLRMFLVMGLWAMLFWGLFIWIFGWQVNFIYSLLGALLFCGFILHDTSQIINHMGCDDYAIATIELYLDIINLFLFILSMLGNRR